nr:hypothetical protein [Tanacetum cinerariifolium]
MLFEGSELTKEDRESHLYDDFKHFRQHKEESINDYYVRGLRESNYDQLFAYLKQYEAHAKENKMVLERLSQPTAQPTADPLALLSNVSNTQHGSPSSSSTSSIIPLHPPRVNSTDDLIENLTSTLALLTQSYITFLPQTNNQLRTSSNPRNQATVQDGRVVVQNVQGQHNTGGQDNVFDDYVDEQPVQDLALNVDNVFQAEDCDAFDSDVKDHDQYLDDTFAYQEEHVMHDSVQLDHVVDLHAYYTSVDKMIPYDQYVKDNDVPVVHSNASSVQNDTFMMIYNECVNLLCPTCHGMQ